MSRAEGGRSACEGGKDTPGKMSGSGGTFVDRIDPFAKRSLKKKPKRSQGSSRYRTTNDVELQPLPLLKGKVADGRFRLSAVVNLLLLICLLCLYILIII